MEKDPLELLYCWQSILLSISVYTLTRPLKNLVLLRAGHDPLKKAYTKNVVLPLVPISLGVALSVFFPPPEPLVMYVAAKSVELPWRLYMMWGAAVGVFAETIHHRFEGGMSVVDAHKEVKASKSNGGGRTTSSVAIPAVRPEEETGVERQDSVTYMLPKEDDPREKK